VGKVRPADRAEETKKVFTEGNEVNEGLQIFGYLPGRFKRPSKPSLPSLPSVKKDQLSRISKRREHAFDIPSIEPFVESL
jgi:hypothetical protein